MSALYFSGPTREAAQHILDHTPLGIAVATFGRAHENADPTGTRVVLVVELSSDAPVSTGEQLLWDFLASLAGRKSINLADTLAGIDRDSQLAVIWALGLATGHFAAASPVTFGAPL